MKGAPMAAFTSHSTVKMSISPDGGRRLNRSPARAAVGSAPRNQKVESEERAGRGTPLPSSGPGKTELNK